MRGGDLSFFFCFVGRAALEGGGMGVEVELALALRNLWEQEPTKIGFEVHVFMYNGMRH